MEHATPTSCHSACQSQPRKLPHGPLIPAASISYVDQGGLSEPIGTTHAPCSSCFWKQLPLYRPWPSQAFSSSRFKNPESHQNISNQSINLSIFPPLLIIKMLLYDMVPQSEEALAVTPVTGRKLLSHCPVGQLQCSCCHPPIKGTGASSVLSK